MWPTPTGKAMFSVYKGVKEDADVLGAEQVLRLITLRSHDQYNTTIYGPTTAIAACSAGATCCS